MNRQTLTANASDASLCSSSATSSSPSLVINNSPFLTLAPEVFIKICSNLPPIDLLSLTRVCRLFYQYLGSGNSTSTNLIWRQARETYLPYHTIGPPNGVSERNYVRLLVEKTCQLCGKHHYSGYRILFEFSIRCCPECVSQNLTDPASMYFDLGMSMDIIRGLPFIARPRIQYWLPQAKKYLEEYKAVPDEDKETWLEEKTEEAKIVMKGAQLRAICRKNEKDNHKSKLSEKKQQRYQQIRNRVTEMVLTDKKSDGSPRWSLPVIQNHCTCYIEAMSSHNTLPFNNRAWNILRRKIEREYPEAQKKYRCRQIQEKITQMSRETDQTGRPKWNRNVIEKFCPSVTAAMQSGHITPFNDRDWAVLHRKIGQEYVEAEERYLRDLNSSLNESLFVTSAFLHFLFDSDDEFNSDY